jgi:putative membrane protein
MWIFLASWFANCLALYILARFLPGIKVDNLIPQDGGFITQQGFITLLIGSAILGFLNSCISPILKFLSIPLTCLTLGLFSFVITGLIFYIAAHVTPGMHVANFWWAMLGGVLFGVLNSMISGFLGVKKH